MSLQIDKATDKQLHDEINRIAKIAMRSGKSAKRRAPHMYIGKVLFCLLSMISIGAEKEFANGVGKLAESVMSEYAKREIRE